MVTPGSSAISHCDSGRAPSLQAGDAYLRLYILPQVAHRYCTRSITPFSRESLVHAARCGRARGSVVVRELGDVAKCLPCKHNDLSSVPRVLCKNPGTCWHV